jgi:hypothetical protein
LENKISYDGFLSSDMNEWIEKIRSENQAWYDYCIRLNQFGEKILTEATVQTTFGSVASKQLIAFLLTVRTLSNLQGALLMVERGMIIEGRTLARSILENSFYIAAIHEKGDEFADRMIEAQHLFSKKFGNHLFGLKLLDKNKADEIAAYLNVNKDNPKGYLSVNEVVKIGNQNEMYTFYSTLSNDAAHPSMRSLNRYMAEGGKSKNQHLDAMPVLDMEETLAIISVGVLSVYEFAIKIFANNKSADFEKLADDFKKLEKKSLPGQNYISPVLTGLSSPPD